MTREKLIKLYEKEYNNNYSQSEYSMVYVAKDLIDFAQLAIKNLNEGISNDATAGVNVIS